MRGSSPARRRSCSACSSEWLAPPTIASRSSVELDAHRLDQHVAALLRHQPGKEQQVAAPLEAVRGQRRAGSAQTAAGRCRSGRSRPCVRRPAGGVARCSARPRSPRRRDGRRSTRRPAASVARTPTTCPCCSPDRGWWRRLPHRRPSRANGIVSEGPTPWKCTTSYPRKTGFQRAERRVGDRLQVLGRNAGPLPQLDPGSRPHRLAVAAAGEHGHVVAPLRQRSASRPTCRSMPPKRVTFVFCAHHRDPHAAAARRSRVACR